MKAIDVGEIVTTDAGKKFVETFVQQLSTSKSQVANAMVPPEEITRKVKEVITKHVVTSTINLNKLIEDRASIAKCF